MLHGLRGLGRRIALAHPQSAWTPCPGRRNRRAGHVEVDGHVGYYCAGMNKLATVVILAAMRGLGVAENIMSGRVEVGATPHRPRAPRAGRPHRDRRQRLGPLRHLHEGGRHRSPRLGRPYERLHGAGRSPGRVGRRRRRAWQFDLRGAALCARRGEEPRRRLCREADAGRTQSRIGGAARLSGTERHGRPRARFATTALLGRSIISRSTTSHRTDGAAGPLDPHSATGVGTFDEFPRSRNFRRAAATGIYDIRGFGAPSGSFHTSTISCFSARRSLVIRSRGYREKCGTDVTIGTRFAPGRRSRSTYPSPLRA